MSFPVDFPINKRRSDAGFPAPEKASAKKTRHQLIMSLTQKTEFRPIPETEDYLDLFPHRWDFIYSNRSKGFQKSQWKTEHRHSLSDRLILQGAHYYGVRFGQETGYAMIDIDADSPYHPRHDEYAIPRLLDAIEPLGLVRHLTLTSSQSGGLHPYLPLPEELPSWAVSEALHYTLTGAGFTIAGGTLELFPNRRTDGTVTYAAHRLPLQCPKSQLLNADYQPILTSGITFLTQWRTAAAANTTNLDTLKLAIATYRRRKTKLSTTAEKFLQDLETEVAPGWTAHHQTNHLLGRIVLLGYCFGHILDDRDKPIAGESLVTWTIDKARSLPGFKEFCRHQASLHRRIREWVRSCEANPRYFPYAIGKSSKPSDLISDGRSQNAWNILQEQLAKSRIGLALEQLPGSLSLEIDELVQFLRSKGISVETLYRHKELWHPKFYRSPEPSKSESSPISLLPEIDRNSLSGKGFNAIARAIYQKIDRNPLSSAGLSRSGDSL